MIDKDTILEQEEIVNPQSEEQAEAQTNEQDSDKEANKEKSTKKNKKSSKKDIEAELKMQLTESNDQYMRLAAEFENFRRRTAKEKIELISTAGESVIVGLLPTLDVCARALQMLGDSAENAAAKEGTELIYTNLLNYLKTKGVQQVECIGQELDTDFHEAVAQFPVQDEEKKNKIIDIAEQGYTLNGKVIRFAKVVVGI